MITSEQMLTHYDPALPVGLAFNASTTGIGAVLSHVMPDGSERPVAFCIPIVDQDRTQVCTD